ncbi:hypothetical protein DD237_005721 [Peronospora effusa]|uniref:Uncharacterized protein n=1 Tax=Peronospora effusa TaxID=542832 RepID=A0A425C890_9STRA|nr:hypothetical protein DD237_005721 [Peronospora effusa]
MTSVARSLDTRLAIPAHYSTFAIYPLPLDDMVAALHIWTLDGVDICDVPNSVIRGFLDSLAPPALPLSRLDADGET